jgi:hypothetical protein
MASSQKKKEEKKKGNSYQEVRYSKKESRIYIENITVMSKFKSILKEMLWLALLLVESNIAKIINLKTYFLALIIEAQGCHLAFIVAKLFL